MLPVSSLWSQCREVQETMPLPTAESARGWGGGGWGPEHYPTHPKVVGSIPGGGAHRRQPIGVSLPSSLPLSLKSKNTSLGEDAFKW